MSKWLDWAKQLQAISQAGHAYSTDKYDLERFTHVGDIAHQMMAELSDTPVEKVKSLFIGESGYPTPKIDVRAAIIRDNKILLVKEREDNAWTMPGGWGDVCETPKQGVVREVLEETGFIVTNPRLFAIKDRSVHHYQPIFPFHIYKLFFLCDYVSGTAKTNIEISDIGDFSLDNLPTLSQSRILKEDIDMAFDYFNHPDKEIWVD